MADPSKSSDAEYVKRIEAERREKDHFFKEDPSSPIPWALREKFTGLAYFPPNPKYRLRVKLQRYPKPEPVVLATSKGCGKESYPAGRYLDLPLRKDDEYVLDFNLAYNPYCAYNDAYVCPLPPRENWHDIRIEAGEKNFPLEELKERLAKEGKPLGHQHH